MKAVAELFDGGSGPPETRPVRVEARDRGALLVQWLEELVFLAETERFVPEHAEIILSEVLDATVHGRISLERRQELVASLRAVPDQVRGILDREQEIKTLAHRYSKYRNFLYTGRGLGYPVALEGALKLKEISYVHAEGVTGGELKHGPIALLDAKFPVIAICTASPTAEKMVSNVHEIVARDAPVLALVTEGDDSLDGVVSPGGVGYDINCGVRLLALPLTEAELGDRREALVHELSRTIPAGAGK